ncbi:putative indole-3-acetic acid-amido synthetase GH3-9 [Nymphaea thermarum]|nr:putative indole-3-acetic acid-amido synthetase GH3-9 [Nymphaea thermarum]
MEMLEMMEEMTNNIDGEQEKVLADILSLNAHTEYLQRHGLTGNTDRELFKTRLPVVSYEDIRPDIQSIADGDRSPILSALPLSHFIYRAEEINIHVRCGSIGRGFLHFLQLRHRDIKQRAAAERRKQTDKFKTEKPTEEMSNNVDGEQEKVLADILFLNAHTEYLQRHGLAGKTDRESFQKKLPVVSYEDIQPDIHRIANGDRSPILSALPLLHFLGSSGTSGGEKKMLPLVEGDHDRVEMVDRLMCSLMNRHGSGLKHGKVINFVHVRKEWKTGAGIVVRSVSASWYKSNHFLSRHLYNTTHTSPVASIHCTDMFQSIYSQLLAGLADRLSVVQLSATYALGLLQVIRFLQRHYQDLATDIEKGTVDPRITDEDVRVVLETRLAPDAENAAHIRKECGRGQWKGIVRRIWPNAQCLEAAATGSMSPYVPVLEFYSDGLPLVSLLYASSECFFGVNLNPFCKQEDVAYTILPNLGYFEFLPVESPESCLQSAGLVNLADVQMGKEYEIVVTTYSGLYRHRVGDILRVVSFYNKAPQFKFVRRGDAVLSLDLDKTSEADLQKAVGAVEATHLIPHNMRVAEFTGYADTTTTPGHYVIYWELSPTKDHTEGFSADYLIGQCCLAIEESLDETYKEMRVYDRSIGPLEIKVVKNGTFDRLMDFAVSNGASVAQYKPPRCVKSASILQILDAAVVSTHFSSRPPSWSN